MKKKIIMSAAMLLLAGMGCAQRTPSNPEVISNNVSLDSLEALKKAKADAIARLRPLDDLYTRLRDDISAVAKDKKDQATISAQEKKFEAVKNDLDLVKKEIDKINGQIMDNYPSSIEAANILIYTIGRMRPEEGLAKYDKLSEEAKSSMYGKMIKVKLDGMRAGSPGANAPEFSGTELRGEKISLSDYKGKYVLIDFWASWCVPCRKGNPHLLALYTKYKGKGFEIIGISDDDVRPEAWKKAVQEDKIGVWKHILRGYKKTKNGDDMTSDISDKYGISSLPTKVLVDPNGKVIGRYGGGGENDVAMDKKLAEIFGS